MSKNTKKIAKTAGITMVALSGAIPTFTPAVNDAQAITLALPLAGEIKSGIALTAVQSLKFGSFVATAKTGSFGISTAGTADTEVGAKELANKAVGRFTYTAEVVGAIDVKVSKIGEQTLGALAGVATPTGKILLKAIRFGTKLGAGALNLSQASAAATTAKVDDYVNQTKAAANLDVGGLLTWGAAANPNRPPVGQFTVPAPGITLSISF